MSWQLSKPANQEGYSSKVKRGGFAIADDSVLRIGNGIRTVS